MEFPTPPPCTPTTQYSVREREAIISYLYFRSGHCVVQLVLTFSLKVMLPFATPPNSHCDVTRNWLSISLYSHMF